jgi:predicted RNase H-like nuclease (RuvC/YqgF family)
MSGAQEPEDVLEAVRQLESQLDHLRSRVREQAPSDPRVTSELRQMREEAMRERRAVVDDLRMVVDLVAASAQRTTDEIGSLRQEVRELRELADTALSGAKFEIRMHTNGHASGPANTGPALPVSRPRIVEPDVDPTDSRRPNYPIDVNEESVGA